jgi:3-oxoacyl-ACP reductase-like protein
MLARSFRFVAPRPAHRSLAVVAALSLTLAIIVAGCGGSAKRQSQLVIGTGFRFSAPAGWVVSRNLFGVTATHGGQFVRVSSFPLAKPYLPTRFAAVAKELEARMSALVAQSGGKVQGTKVATAAGIKAHVWDIATGDNLDEYTFVLKGLREYQLLCHRPAGDDDSACSQLVQSLQLT